MWLAIQRSETVEGLVAEIYRRMWTYNHTRIYSALRMPPPVFAKMMEKAGHGPLENLQKALLLTCPKNPDLANR